MSNVVVWVLSAESQIHCSHNREDWIIIITIIILCEMSHTIVYIHDKCFGEKLWHNNFIHNCKFHIGYTYVDICTLVIQSQVTCGLLPAKN